MSSKVRIIIGTQYFLNYKSNRTVRNVGKNERHTHFINKCLLSLHFFMMHFTWYPAQTLYSFVSCFVYLTSIVNIDPNCYTIFKAVICKALFICLLHIIHNLKYMCS